AQGLCRPQGAFPGAAQGAGNTPGRPEKGPEPRFAGPRGPEAAPEDGRAEGPDRRQGRDYYRADQRTDQGSRAKEIVQATRDEESPLPRHRAAEGQRRTAPAAGAAGTARPRAVRRGRATRNEVPPAVPGSL